MTDNTPIYILGGNILPFGQGGMTTTEARTSPLKLVVALASATSNAIADRCSGKCSMQEVSNSCISHPILPSVQCRRGCDCHGTAVLQLRQRLAQPEQLQAFMAGAAEELPTSLMLTSDAEYRSPGEDLWHPCLLYRLWPPVIDRLTQCSQY